MGKPITFEKLVSKLTYRATPVTVESIDALLRTATAYVNAGCRVPSHTLDQLVRRRAEWNRHKNVPEVVRRACEKADRNQQHRRDIEALGGSA